MPRRDYKRCNRAVSDGFDFGVTWSPDGRHIAFVRVFGFAQGAEQDVYVMDADGKHQRALLKGAKQLLPSWQPLD